MMRAGQWLPVIAIAENPSISAVVKAIKVGALDSVTAPNRSPTLNEAVARSAREADAQRLSRARAAEARQRIGPKTPKPHSINFKIKINRCFNKFNRSHS